MQWKTPHDFGVENYMMPMGPPPGYNSYWNGMQPMDGFMAPYGGPMQMMGYGLGPLDMPFAGGMPQDPFGMQGYMMPVVPPHRYILVTLKLKFGTFLLSCSQPKHVLDIMDLFGNLFICNCKIEK